MIRLLSVVVFLSILLINLHCTREIHRIEPPEITDGEYDSEFPAKPASQAIEEILRSVKLLSTIAFYESYEFTRENEITLSILDDDIIEERSSGKYHFNQPATGTATVVYRHDRNVALLTCAHIVGFPDTIVAYYRDDRGRETKFIHTAAFKIRQNINIIDFYLGSDFEILAMDEKNDIALIGKYLNIQTPFVIPVFNYPKGKAEQLNWGNFVYILGYPRGEKMITRAMISRPSRDKGDSFLLDAVFNRGFSGGIVLAIRDGIPNFELVGMAKSVPAETKLYLAPDLSFKILEASPQEIYTGEAKVQTYENIFYGITYAVNMEAIERFIEENAYILKEKGYKLNSFFPSK